MRQLKGITRQQRGRHKEAAKAGVRQLGGRHEATARQLRGGCEAGMDKAAACGATGNTTDLSPKTPLIPSGCTGSRQVDIRNTARDAARSHTQNTFDPVRLHRQLAGRHQRCSQRRSG
eukprot:307604-Chlamydomonas_euryale.AAC.1